MKIQHNNRVCHAVELFLCNNLIKVYYLDYMILVVCRYVLSAVIDDND